MAVTILLIDLGVHRLITTGPGNSGTSPKATSVAVCSAVLMLCGTFSSALKYSKVLEREVLSSGERVPPCRQSRPATYSTIGLAANNV